MKRWMYATRTLSADPELVTKHIVNALPTVLQEATGQTVTPPDGDGDVFIVLRAGRRFSKGVRVHVGEAQARRAGVAVPLQWHAAPGSHLFPVFAGCLEVERLSAGQVSIALVGTYTPPLGPLGAGIDDALLSHVAHDTALWLLNEIAAALIDRVQGTSQLQLVPTSRGRLVVSQIMTADDITFNEDQSLREAAGVLLHHGISGAAVIDPAGTVVGVLSERDLLNRIQRLDRRDGQAAPPPTVVGEICSRPARTTQASTPVRDAAAAMARHDVDRLVVLDGATHVGIVTRTDALKALTRDEEELRWAVWSELCDFDGAEVQITIHDGVVALDGDVQLRSAVPVLVGRVRQLDGVIDVRSDAVGWQIDDVSPPAPTLRGTT